MIGKHIFVVGRFVNDLTTYLDRSSTRKIAENSGGLLSASKVSRITTGKYRDLKIDEILYICGEMEKSPYDYIDRVMF